MKLFYIVIGIIGFVIFPFGIFLLGWFGHKLYLRRKHTSSFRKSKTKSSDTTRNNKGITIV